MEEIQQKKLHKDGQKRKDQLQTGLLHLSSTLSDLFFIIATDAPVETAIELFGENLRAKRNSSQKRGRVNPIPPELPCFIVLQPCEHPKDLQTQYETCFHGLVLSKEIFIEEGSELKKISISRKYEHQSILSVAQNMRTFLYLDTPTEFELSRVSLFQDFRIFSIDPSGNPMEKFLKTDEELQTLLKQKEAIEKRTGEEIQFQENLENKITQMHFTREKHLPVSEFEDEGDNATTNVETQVNIHLNKPEESLYSGNDSEAARVAAHYEVKLKIIQAAHEEKLKAREEMHRQEIDELKDQFSQVMQKLGEFQILNTKEKNELKAERNVYKDTVLRMEKEMSYMRLEIEELKQKQQHTSKKKSLASPLSDLLEFGNPDKDLDLSIEVVKKDLPDYIGYPSSESYDDKDGEIFFKTKKTKLTSTGSKKSAKKSVKSIREDLTALYTPLNLSTVVKTSSMEVEAEEEVTDFVVTREESKEHEIEEGNSNNKSVLPEIDFAHFEAEAQTLKPPTLMQKLLTQAQQSVTDSSSREKPSNTAPELTSILNVSVPLSQEIIDGYLKITHESKPKRSFYIFDSNVWPLIETEEAEVLDASVFLGKENIILPMFVSFEDVENPHWQLLRNANKIRSHWVLMVLVDESRKWDDKSQVVAYYFDSSGSQKTPKSFLPRILEYISVCIFSTSKKQYCLSKKYLHPVNNMPTLFDCTQTPRMITIPNQLSIYSSGVHLLFHIDKIISNPRSHLFEETQVKSLNPYKEEEFDRKFRGHIKQTFTDFYKRNLTLLNEQNSEDRHQASEEQVIERERLIEQPKSIKKNIRAKPKSDGSFQSQTESKKKAEKGSKIN